MGTQVRFDFVRNDYFFDETYTLQPQKKSATKRAKTDATIRDLFGCQAALHRSPNAFSVEQTYSLKVFTKELSEHIETSIEKRYGCLSWFIIALGKSYKWSPLGQLKELQVNFYTALNKQKQTLLNTLPSHIQEPTKDTSKLLGDLFLIDPTSSSGVAKVDALYKLLREHGSFTPSETIQLAWFIENSLSTAGRIKKDPENSLPRTIYNDSAAGRVFISQKGSKQPPLAATKVKKVTKALMADLQRKKVSTIAQLTTQDKVSEHVRIATANEYTIAQEFRGKTGIWPVLHSSEYIKQRGVDSISKVSYFSNLGTSDFTALAKELPFDAFFTLSKILLEGLKTIHEHGYVHADIKSANALITPTKDNAGWIDFGLSGKTSDERLKNFYKNGFYGTRKFTAPELFGVQGFCGDYCKTDVWAFGLMLYRAYFQKDPPWFAFFPKDKPIKTDYTTKGEYQKAIEQEISLPLKRLLQKKPLGQKERFEAMIYKMLLPNPKKRPTAEEAFKELTDVATDPA